MKHGQSLSADHGWNASNATPYATFKGLAASVAVLLRPAGADKRMEGAFGAYPKRSDSGSIPEGADQQRV